jgi:hypothetical protein
LVEDLPRIRGNNSLKNDIHKLKKKLNNLQRLRLLKREFQPFYLF